MRELTMEEVEQVGGGGITQKEAGVVLVGFGTAVVGGAILGGIAGITAGPVGVFTGAVLGAGRAAFSYGFGALIGGAYALAC